MIQKKKYPFIPQSEMVFENNNTAKKKQEYMNEYFLFSFVSRMNGWMNGWVVDELFRFFSTYSDFGVEMLSDGAEKPQGPQTNV